MNVLVPSAPAGAPAVAGGSEGASSMRRESGDGDFAEALNEVAGDRAGEEKSATKSKETGSQPRVAQRPDPRIDTASDQPAFVTEEAPPLSTDAVDDNLPAGRTAPVAAKKEVKSADEASLPTVSAPDAAASTSVRDVLAALVEDLTAKSQLPTSSGPLAEAIGRVIGNPASVASRTGKADDPVAPHAPAMPTEEIEGEILPVRVVREERHFRPVPDASRFMMPVGLGGEDVEATSPAPVATSASAVVAQQREMNMGAVSVAARGPDATTGINAATVAAPVQMPESVGVQIADRVQQTLSGPTEVEPQQQAQSAPSPNPTTPPAFAPAIRTLKLQLNPASLGMVTVMITGGEDALRIHLEADLADTVGMVEQDRGVLSARLNGAGYAITELTVARMSGQEVDTGSRDAARSANTQGDGGGGASRESGAGFSGDREGRQAPSRHPANEWGFHDRQRSGVAAQHVVSGISYASRFRPV